jgi:cytochrome c-type biogenesis protein CcmH
MRRWGAALVVAVLLSLTLAAPLLAVDPAERLTDPSLEARAREISRELRCLVCQNQSIDDSNADLAQDLRRVVRQRLAAGDSDQAVMDYVVSRYGQFVLLKPPVQPATWPLWFGPAVILLIGAGACAVFIRRSQARVEPPPPLSDSEEERLRQILDGQILDGQILDGQILDGQILERRP